MQYIWINGARALLKTFISIGLIASVIQEDQGQNVDIRVPPNNNPVKDVTSKDLTCNVGGLSGASVNTATIPAGATVFTAKTPSDAKSFDDQGTVWTKIYSSGLLDPSSQQWASDVVNTNNGKHNVTISASLPAGQYLLGAEIARIFARFSFTNAKHFNISDGGRANLPKIAIPGNYKSTDPSNTVNIYHNLESYTAPGGPVWSG
ncbi:glycosyl hydrolase family 61-domain-containing protein [Cristinia sonorae]|uniref:lytic cellulose monooxygenase (C4-dehydrogenating) n=1 Tax=Cristinia sonorae TaxID=1940300 RepID=A0A8K0UY77_9AGAR|nr:glycosyl hydrolase family 61-domain-containing protein [Cristinia sonorae]